MKAARRCDCEGCRAARRPRFRRDPARNWLLGERVLERRPLVRAADRSWVRSLRAAPEGVLLLADLRWGAPDGTPLVVTRDADGCLRVAIDLRVDEHGDTRLRPLLELAMHLAPPGELEPFYLDMQRCGALDVYGDMHTGRVAFAYDNDAGAWLLPLGSE